MRIIKKAFTFDDVLLVPTYSEILPRNAVLQTRLTEHIHLNIPILSAAMDTVTETRMAITVAQEGGMGIIHKNMPAHIQAEKIAKVKRFEAGVVKEPITVNPDMTVQKVLSLIQKNKISALPVVQGTTLVGIVTNRDLRFETNLEQPVSNIMTKQDKLVTVLEGTSVEDAKVLMHTHRIERVLVVNDKFELAGLINIKDMLKSTSNPNAAKDPWGRLRVGAAVGTGREDKDRVERLVSAGVDLLIVDTAHGHSQGVMKRVEWVKSRHPHIAVIGGNIATADAARALRDAGADAVKVGIGPGSICTTRIVAGVGVPQITAIADVAEALEGTYVTVIADGGIRYSGDISKALAAGANCVMLGNLLAGTDDAPGDMELYKGRYYKAYRGMGSLSAMKKGSADRYQQDAGQSVDKLVPEGIEGRVPYRGTTVGVIHQLMGGLRSSMGYLGCKNLFELRSNATFVEITASGARESHVHDVQITKEAPNYSIE